MNYFQKPKTLLILFISIVVFTGCSSNGVLPESPEISVHDVDIVEIGLNNQKFLFNLNAFNQNKFALPIRGIEFDLSLSDVKVGSGFGGEDISLASASNTLIPVEVETNLVESVDNFKKLFLSGGLNLEYKMTGKLQLVGESIGIPFSVTGNLME
jgi:LEA14-like dessication related protein